MAVHAHPDDEAIWTGGLLAGLARRGADVTVVTCTLGEEGEIIGDTFAALDNKHADQLGGFRIHELAASLRALGVAGRFLGYPGKYRDSGMDGDPANDRPRAFIRHRREAEDDLRAIIDEIGPQLLVTYEADGGYGHPDHKQAHALTAAVMDTTPADTPRRMVCCVTDAATLRSGLEAITVVPAGWRRALDNEIACHDLSERDPATVVAVPLEPADLDAKCRAMKAHATQLWIADGSVSATNPRAALAAVSDPGQAPHVFALSNLIAQPVLPVELYTCHRSGVPYPAGAACPAAGLPGIAGE